MFNIAVITGQSKIYLGFTIYIIIFIINGKIINSNIINHPFINIFYYINFKIPISINREPEIITHMFSESFDTPLIFLPEYTPICINKD
mgnify:CR=1 FL=1